MVANATLEQSMKISTAVAMRISKLLHERGISQYRFERDNAIPHNTKKKIKSEKNSSVNLKTVMQFARGFNMTVSEFFNDPVFENPDLEIE